jgi:hypothetical protein
MHTYAQKPKTIQPTTSAKSTTISRAHFGQDRDLNSILNLQRTIGNQAVLRMLRTHAEETDVGYTAAASPRFRHDFSQIPIHPPTAGVIQMKLAINKPGGEYEQDAPEIQRAATWVAGAVHQTNNLANLVVYDREAGETTAMLNGSFSAILKRPTLAFSSAANGGVNAKVATVPTNTGSFDETVLAPPPWTIAAPKATIGKVFPTLEMCTGAGDTTFQAIGDPSDEAMFASVRRHEDHHVEDIKDAFNTTIVPWDTKLTKAQVAGTEFNGPTEVAAEEDLYAAMGGWHYQVAAAFVNAMAAASNAYHGTAAGGPIREHTPTANADCSTSSAKCTSPA